MIDNITYFTFDVSKCNDDAIKCYKKRIIKFSKLEYIGLHIEDSYTGVVNFDVDKQTSFSIYRKKRNIMY